MTRDELTGSSPCGFHAAVSANGLWANNMVTKKDNLGGGEPEGTGDKAPTDVGYGDRNWC
jgi:hypothetical protein